MTNLEESSRRDRASRRLHATDAAAEFVVTIGGFAVLAAVLGICLYLAWVVVPLFSSGHVEEGVVIDGGDGEVVARNVYLDPYGGAAVFDRGEMRVVGLKDGTVLGELDERVGVVVSVSSARNGEMIARGYLDGTVRLGGVKFLTKLYAAGEGVDVDTEGVGYGTVLEDGRVRRVVAEVSFGDAMKLKGGEGAVVLVDFQVDTTGKTVLAALRADGTVVVSSVRTTRPLGGGKAKIRLRETSFGLVDDERPVGLKVSADGGQAFVVYGDGAMDRYSREKTGKKGFVYRERVEMLGGGEDGGEVAVVEMVLGGQTILIGDTLGGVQSWHVGTDERDRFGDGRSLVRSHVFGRAGEGVGVVDLTPSGRDRTVGVLYSDGVVVLRHLTSEKTVIRIESREDGVVGAGLVAIGPKNDVVLVVGEDGVGVYGYEPGYAEFSIKALFGKVVYEGLSEPSYVYQSSSGDDSSEVKLSLMPLIFGTLKATVFAMLFAIPVAVFAAMYSSEFLSGRVRKVVKPSVELMASLPSVVLGFVAAMVVAPYVAGTLGAFLIGMFVLPFGVLFGAHVWQLVPLAARMRLRTGHHLVMVGGVLVLSGVVAWFAGPVIVGVGFAPDDFDRAMMSGRVVAVDDGGVPGWAEDAGYSVRTRRRLRAMGMGVVDGVVVEREGVVDGGADDGSGGLDRADLRRWLNGEYGKATPGWVLALFPLASLGVWIVQAVTVRRRVDVWLAGQSSVTVGAVVLAKFVGLSLVSLGVAYGVAVGLNSVGIDPRDSIFGGFSPRNTLVVAVIMGFAVIPIIFTISEDALRAVPDSLRSASLGAGATKWQTAVRIVLPVAGSGIFSACMIGFGRAVGETMIVLMATGNTPEMSWNIFSGFRTLAANIAVELPEAPKGETHYRVLFLCGFVLFVMTFVINTSAEVVRQVVRKRNAGL